MEFEFPSKLIVLVSFFLFIFIVLKLLGWNSKTNSSPLNLIPGPRKLPLIGNLHLLVGNPLPHRTFRDLADKYGPLMHLQLGEVPFIKVSSIEFAKQILKTHDLNFANRPPVFSVKASSYNYTDIAFSPYGEYWRNLRKICILELLSARCVQSFRHIREEENRDLQHRLPTMTFVADQQGIVRLLFFASISFVAKFVGNPLPHRAFRDLADKYGPLMHLQLGEVPFIIVSSIEVAKQILKTHDLNFANRPPVFSVKTKLLSARRVQSFRHIREEENRDLAKWIASNEGLPINMSERIYLSTYDITTRASLGKKTSEKGTFTSMMKEVVKLAGGLSIADLYPSIRFLPLITGIKFRIERMHQKTDRILNSIIDEHKVSSATKTDDDEKTEDLADILLKYQEDGVELPLTTDNVKAILMDEISLLDWN
ncbi:hypothetical protein BUALT_Bualt10G0097000 [Buddleja alternifolia]|uniref:Cytochrome P450 n=1 Tax=Buddleja alternifolia TaxID=168488 RepID=A0AAV6WYW2_9LAMI|nr:hypothetical protein BUALT_Bualt10G0097000 [Buddleja alternifolia]